MSRSAPESYSGLAPEINYQWVIFAILSISHMLLAMVLYSWGPLAAELQIETQINNSQLGFIISAMYLTMVIVSVPSGILVDRCGARKMLIPSVSLTSLSFFEVLFVVAGLGGIGYGMINQVTTKGLMNCFESTKRATIMGIKQSGVTIGRGLIAIYIPVFGQAFGWRRSVLFLALAISAVVLASIFLHQEKPDVDMGPPSGGLVPKRADLQSILLEPVLISLTLIFALWG
ncbi:MAG: MFS transporter [Desulfatiglans sp.]|jgi:MFS family permease|nr:MFS transporter [Desulfatiglans sp.]